MRAQPLASGVDAVTAVHCANLARRFQIVNTRRFPRCMSAMSIAWR